MQKVSKRIVKGMFKTSTIVAAMLVATGASAAAREVLDVQLSLDSAVVQGDSQVAVHVTVTNTTGHDVKVLKSQLPSKHLQGPLFRVLQDDGTPAAYVGPLVKRAAPTAKDFVALQAGASLSYTVDLSRDYALGNGHYRIEYVGGGLRQGAVDFASTAPAELWTQGRSAVQAEFIDPEEAVQAQTDELLGRAHLASISYTGACTSTEKSTLVSAVSAATTYATNTTTYLSGTPSATQRYVKWFGTYSSSGWNTAKSHFTNETSAFTTQPLTLDCSCNDSGTYAYVYANQPYKIYLCGAFWSAPMTGTDSKGGTLVHEMSHFTVVAGTDDWAYGQTKAARLAKTNPTKALDNADSHEYFAENNPSLP